jgi:hypothetical protein
MVLFADDISITVTDINKLNFDINLKQTFKDINTWFTSNLLALNIDKTQYMEFRPMNFLVWSLMTRLHGNNILNTLRKKFP